MAYPSHILPIASYHRHIDMPAMYHQGFFPITVRRCCVNDSEAFLDGEVATENITDAALGNITGLSMNLLGGPFKPHDSHWRQLGEGQNEWDGNDVDLKNFEGLFAQTDPGCRLLYFETSRLVNPDFHYPVKANNVPELENALQYFEVVNDSMSLVSKPYTAEVKGILYVGHRPTNLNYWHTQLCLSTILKSTTEIDTTQHPVHNYEDSALYEPIRPNREKKPYIKNILTEEIKKNVILEQPTPIPSIEQHHYIRQ